MLCAGAYAVQAEDESESVEAVENLLESYFMQVDSAFDRLCTVGEYIQDTEEFVNIELDSARNRLIRLEIVLTAATFALSIFALVGGEVLLRNAACQVPHAPAVVLHVVLHCRVSQVLPAGLHDMRTWPQR